MHYDSSRFKDIIDIMTYHGMLPWFGQWIFAKATRLSVNWIFKKNPLEMLWVRPTQRSWSWKSHALYSSQWCVLLWKREIALQVVFSCFRKEHPRNKNRIQIQMDKYHKKYQRPPRLHSLCRCLDLASPRDPECCYISGKKDDAKKGEAMEGGNAYSGHLVNLGSSIPNDVVWKDEPYLGQWT